MNLEHEIKGLITKETFSKIVNTLKVEQIIKQSNYYFETENNFYKNNHSALRIREKNNTFELTLKRKVGKSNEEFNSMVTKKELDDVFTTHTINFSNHPIKPSEQLCKSLIIKTERYCINYMEHVFEIDKTDFNGTIDYEIELEAESIEKAEAIFNAFLKEFSIQVAESKPKIARYLQYNNNEWRSF